MPQKSIVFDFKHKIYYCYPHETNNLNPHSMNSKQNKTYYYQVYQEFSSLHGLRRFQTKEDYKSLEKII